MNSIRMRRSNFELLRIVAMLMIILCHIALHTIQTQLIDEDSIKLLNNDFFSHPVFYKKLFILNLFLPLGKVGNTVFLLISGSFMIERKEIDLIKITKRLLFPLIFTATALTLISFGFRYWFPNKFIFLLPITNVNTQSWFLGYYFLIILFAALFLNRFLNRFEKKQYLTFLLVFFAVFSFGWAGSLLNQFAESLRTLTAGVFVYSLGGYIRLYDPFKRVRTYILFLMWGIIGALFYLSHYNTVRTAAEEYYLKHTSKPFTQVLLTSFHDYSMFVIVLGVCLFEIFRRIHIPNSRIINSIAGASIIIYLLHDNEVFYSVWNMTDWITLLYYHPLSFVLRLLLWTLGVMAFGVLMHSLFLGIVALCRKGKRLAIKEENTDTLQA